MASSSLQESKDFSAGLHLLAAVYFWLFMVLLSHIILPRLYRPSLVIPTLLLLFLAVGGSFFGEVRPLRELPALLRGLFFCLLQGGAFSLWVWFCRAERGELLLSPRQIFKFPQWWIPALITWVGAQQLSRLLFGLQNRPSHPVHSWKKQWDEDTLDLTFWVTSWRTFRFTVVALLGIGVVFLAVPANLTGQQYFVPTNLGKILLWLMTCCALALLAGGNYLYQRVFWLRDELKVAAFSPKEWQAQTAQTLLGLSVLAMLLPGNFQAMGWKVMRWIFQKVDSLLQKPAGYELNLESQTNPYMSINGSMAEGAEPGLFQQIVTLLYLLVMLIIAVSIGAVILLFFGALLYRLCKGEIQKLRGLPRVLASLYAFVCQLWQTRRQRTATFGKDPLGQAGDVTASLPKRSKVYSWGRGTRALIRRGYCRLLRSARQQGLEWSASQTPEEIGLALGEMLPAETEAVRIVTIGYEEARYGPEDPPKEKLLHFDGFRRTLQKKLGLVKRSRVETK